MYTKITVLFIIGKLVAKTVIAVGLAVFFVMFFSTKINAIARSVAEQDRRAVLLENHQETNRVLKKEFSRIDPLFEKKLIEAEPSVDDITAFKEVLTGVGSKHALQAIVEFVPPTVETSVDYHVSFAATRDPLIRFFEDFESLPYFTNITSVEIKTSATGDWEKDGTVSLGGSIYTRPPED